MVVTVPPTMTIQTLKEEALSALSSTVNQAEGVPKVHSTDDFELCSAVKEKGRPNGDYEVLDVSRQIRDCGLGSYDSLCLQFRDSSGKFLPTAAICHSIHLTIPNVTVTSMLPHITGDLIPVAFTAPSIEDEVEEEREESPISNIAKGKRKAQFEDSD
ncbi:hypothetical protein H0H81_009619 [Sphagnurus paluster]|uniref:Uncharacterized protein n=1 Tax=Sphagnurus paluster TaxID=117069 RepID=A0A9P7FPK0_9AGAR|nr:hypothetical protein H0H81_009619 [Sphagnurus paluster]